MGFLIKLKDNENVKQALKSTGGNIADLTSNIFVHMKDEDIPELSQKLKKAGFFAENPRIEDAFAEKLQQIGNSANVTKAFNFSAIFCLLLFKLF